MEEVELFKLLADENRLTIFMLLLFSECCVCDLEHLTNLKQANVSKHMMKFKELDVVKSRKVAQWVYYQVNPDFMMKHEALVHYIKEKALNHQKIQNLLKQLKQKQC
jgi:ArsR family transcriptional regulator, arsenate/arsenite/antimonite-responsive transcriptional repressor